MKTLYLVRHAKSDHDGNLTDIDRPLSIRGYRDAHTMSKLMLEKKLTPDLIISSPAVRALSTALVFCRNFKFDPADIIITKDLYETNVKEYMNVITRCDDNHKRIMLFAHNPTISDLANNFTKVFTEDISTCGIVGFTNNCSHWKDFAKITSVLSFYDFPKNHTTGVK